MQTIGKRRGRSASQETTSTVPASAAPTSAAPQENAPDPLRAARYRAFLHAEAEGQLLPNRPAPQALPQTGTTQKRSKAPTLPPTQPQRDDPNDTKRGRRRSEAKAATTKKQRKGQNPSSIENYARQQNRQERGQVIRQVLSGLLAAAIIAIVLFLVLRFLFNSQPREVLQFGLNEAEALEFEQILADNFYLPEPVDGLLDEETNAALVRFLSDLSVPFEASQPSLEVLEYLRAVSP